MFIKLKFFLLNVNEKYIRISLKKICNILFLINYIMDYLFNVKFYLIFNLFF